MDVAESLRIAGDGKDAKRALRHSDGRGFDCVIELTGAQSAHDLATAIVAEGACFVTEGAHSDKFVHAGTHRRANREMRVINVQERLMEHRVGDARKAIQAALEGRLDPFPLLTHKVPLKSLDYGFRLLRERPSGFVKALMVNGLAA
jgi:threonine dehydrogenase-like Zn-dependent dehydrogenase